MGCVYTGSSTGLMVFGRVVAFESRVVNMLGQTWRSVIVIQAAMAPEEEVVLAELRRKRLFKSIALAVLLVGVAFLTVLSEPQHPDWGTSIILVAGFGIPWLIATAGLIKGPIFPTPLLIGAWCFH